MNGAIVAPILVPELKMPVAKARSFRGNHSATALIAAGNSRLVLPLKQSCNGETDYGARQIFHLRYPMPGTYPGHMLQKAAKHRH